MTRVIYETKTLISIYHLSIVHHLKLFPKCIECYWFMASKAKKKSKDWKHLRGGFPWIFIEPKEFLGMVFHDLWAQKQQIVFHGNWNSSAWKCVDLSNEALYIFKSLARRDHILVCTTCHSVNLNLVQRDVVFQTIPKLAWWLEDNKNNHVNLTKQFQ